MSNTASRATSQERRLLIPKAPVLALAGAEMICLTPDGEFQTLKPAAARKIVENDKPLLCHAPYIAARLGLPRLLAYDVLELFAFVHPTRFTVPTTEGLCRTLHLMEPETGEDQCLSLQHLVRHLLTDLSAEEGESAAAIATMMQTPEEGWPWGEAVLAALGRDKNPLGRNEIRAALRIWEKLPEWSIHAPEPPPAHHGIESDEVGERLHRLLLQQKKEDRPEQKEYAEALRSAFQTRNDTEETHVVIAEAGTGVGKTLGYLAPATVWAEKNGGTVWISTYTRNLQRQIDGELDRLYDDPAVKNRKAVTRKGRENYLCLLNVEDASQSPALQNNGALAALFGIMLRFTQKTNDGDLTGKDFPGWVHSLFGASRVFAFADRRGECIYSACPHFNKCFVEKSIRKAKRADIVIANHALIMHQIAGGGDADLPTRFIFDESHHLFEAADSAFDFQLNGTWTADLRRWLLGTETERRSRARGIKRRLEDIVAEDEDAIRDIDDIVDAAHSLPAPNWRQRLSDGAPKGIVENFLSLCRAQVMARAKDQNPIYSLETELHPPIPGLFEAAYALRLRLNDLRRPMLSLIGRLQKKLAEEAETLDTSARERLQYTIRSLKLRADAVIGGWIAMLEAVKDTTPEGMVDFLEISRIDGREDDAGFYRYFVDPGKVFSELLKPHAHGIISTSATLRDASEEDPKGWNSAFIRTGLQSFSNPKTFYIASPFDYKNQTRIYVVKDVRKEDADETAAAFRALFSAAGGGALGLFTSVQRLKQVHPKIASALEKENLRLYAQHIDPINISTLIDIFKEEENACLLGTDATRDGIDVPGRALRLVVYDRVPWPRPTILHKARRNYFGRGYDDMLTRFKLKQAYGRLIRKADDKGVFVMLDSGLPTRLTECFPEGVDIQRVGLKEASEGVKAFLKTPPIHI